MPTRGKLTIAPYSAALEAGIVRVLNAAFPTGWGSDRLWRWKHRDRPGFVDRDVVAALDEGEVVGCFHSGVLPVTIDEGLAVPLCFDGDLAILREFRGQGIPVAARDASERRLFAERVPLRGGFTSPELNARLYEPYFDFIFVPSAGLQFRKVLGVGPLRPRVAQLGATLLARPRVRRALARRPLVVDLHVEGLDSSHLVLSAEGFELSPGLAPAAHLSCRVPYGVLASLPDGITALIKAFASAAARGQVRVRGAVRNAPRLAALLGSIVKGG